MPFQEEGKLVLAFREDGFDVAKARFAALVIQFWSTFWKYR